MNALKTLREVIREQAGSWTQEEILLAETVAADVLRLQSLELAGLDVTREWVEVQAAAASIAAAGAVKGSEILNTWITRMAGSIGSFLLTGMP